MSETYIAVATDGLLVKDKSSILVGFASHRAAEKWLVKIGAQLIKGCKKNCSVQEMIDELDACDIELRILPAEELLNDFTRDGCSELGDFDAISVKFITTQVFPPDRTEAWLRKFSTMGDTRQPECDISSSEDYSWGARDELQPTHGLIDKNHQHYHDIKKTISAGSDYYWASKSFSRQCSELGNRFMLFPRTCDVCHMSFTPTHFEPLGVRTSESSMTVGIDADGLRMFG